MESITCLNSKSVEGKIDEEITCLMGEPQHRVLHKRMRNKRYIDLARRERRRAIPYSGLFHQCMLDG